MVCKNNQHFFLNRPLSDIPFSRSANKRGRLQEKMWARSHGRCLPRNHRNRSGDLKLRERDKSGGWKMFLGVRARGGRTGRRQRDVWEPCLPEKRGWGELFLLDSELPPLLPERAHTKFTTILTSKRSVGTPLLVTKSVCNEN